MKLKELESELQPLKGFETPKRELEQYVTNPHLASRLLFSAESSFGDLDDKRVLDLGCGCGVLSIGAVMLGAASVLSVDVDSAALAIARENIASVEMEDEIELVHARIGTLKEPTARAVKDAALAAAAAAEEEGEKEEEEDVPVFDPKALGGREFDTVVMNPPFGTWNQGIDMVFLEVACQVAETAVYSLHKTSTREFILKKAKTLGFEGEVLAEMKYALPKTMAFHKAKSVDIQVDFFRFVRVAPRAAAAAV
ncbi:hypothetical protein RQP46_004683 [Phenoliferia psychrophenolica]